jgi:phospholipid N-methyltransferase
MDVNFDIYYYKLQEKAFMSFLQGVKNAEKIRHVLELGAGTGRVTKIVQ